MAQHEEKITIWSCDARDCGREAQSRNGNPAPGYTGSVTYVSSSGDEHAADWFACSGRHIRGAVEASIEAPPS